MLWYEVCYNVNDRKNGVSLNNIVIERSTKAYYSTSSLLKKLGYNYQVIVLKRDLIESTKTQSKALGISLASNVYEIKRLLIVEGTPKAIETSFISAELIPEFYNVNLESSPLYTILSDKYNIQIDKSEERIVLAEASKNEKELLKLKDTDVIVITGTSYDTNGRIIELYNTVAVCDFFEFKGETYNDE